LATATFLINQTLNSKLFPSVLPVTPKRSHSTSFTSTFSKRRFFDSRRNI